MSVTPVQAECAIAVAEAGSFRRAAAKLYLSQPSVSAHVQQLEQSLGMTIFDRDTSGTHLTAPGERVLPYLRAFLDQREAVLREAGRIQSGTTSTIRVAGERTPLITWLAAALPVLQGAFGNVNVETEYVRGNGSARMVEAGDVDIGMAVNNWATRPKMPNVEMVVLSPSFTEVYVPAGHRLASETEIESTQLSHETIVSIGGKNGSTHRDMHLVGAEDVRNVSAPDFQAAFEMARTMDAVVLSDTLSGVFADQRWSKVRLRGGIVFDYVLCRRASINHPPAAAALWQLMVSRATAEGSGQTVS